MTVNVYIYNLVPECYLTYSYSIEKQSIELGHFRYYAMYMIRILMTVSLLYYSPLQLFHT